MFSKLEVTVQNRFGNCEPGDSLDQHRTFWFWCRSKTAVLISEILLLISFLSSATPLGSGLRLNWSVLIC